MPCELTNVPATFVMPMNDTLRPYIGKFVVHFIDDILVYNKNIVERAKHLRDVFIALRKVILYTNKKKTYLCVGKLEYLGFIITLDGVEMDPKKMAVIIA